MAGPRLSPETQRRVDLLFPATQRALASTLLVEHCGHNLPFNEHCDEYAMERIRFAVLKLSAGDLTQLQAAIEDAKVDTRDVLVAAGFGSSVQIHQDWLPNTPLDKFRAL